MPTTPPRRIDAHQHFWRTARGDYRWLRPDVPALATICRDFAPADLLALAEANPVIGGVVGWVDLSQAASVATLERWAATHPELKGVRPMLQDLPDVDWIAHAPHPAVMRTLVRLGRRCPW